MDEHFYTLIKLDALTTDAPGWSLHFSPQAPERALQSSLSLPACLLSPLPRSPSVWFPARGELKGSWGQSFGAEVLPGSRASPFLRLTALAGAGAASYPALGTDGGPGGGRGRAVGPLRCAALRCRGAQALLPRGRLCGECSSTDCRRRTSRSSQSVSGSRPLSTARRSCRLFVEGNSR